MVIHLSNECKYVPEWNGNKVDANPIEITYKSPTMSLYSNLIPKPSIVMKMGTDGVMSGGETEMVIDNTRLVKEMVTDIKNCSYIDPVTEKEFKITTGKELFGSDVPSCFAGLVDEVGAFLQGVLSKKVVDAKN